jgi:hypothetical protein
MLQITIIKKITLLLFAISFVNLSQAQWQPDVRLTNDPANSVCTNGKSVSASSLNVHIVWQDNRDGNYEIYYKRSANQGLTWGNDTRLTNSSYFSEFPVISAWPPPNVHIVWCDERDGNYEIYYKRSGDQGITWGSDVRLTVNNAESSYPDMSVYGSTLHIVWDDKRDGLWQVYYKRSVDGGLTWGADTKLSNSTNIENKYPEIKSFYSFVHVFWTDKRDGNSEIYYKRSADGGMTWGADTRLTNNPNNSTAVNASFWANDLRIVWEDDRDGNLEIYYKYSADAGLTWGTDTRFTNNPASSIAPSLLDDGDGFVDVVWEDDRDGNNEIYFKQKMENVWGPDIRLTNNPGFSEMPSFAENADEVHVIWMDNRDGNSEIYYKKNPRGNPSGIANINSEIPEKFSLLQNYPNPFNPVTKIRFDIPNNKQLTTNNTQLIIYDVLGNEIAALVDNTLKPGKYEVDWNATNYPSGIYIYKLVTEDFVDFKKMILIK